MSSYDLRKDLCSSREKGVIRYAKHGSSTVCLPVLALFVVHPCHHLLHIGNEGLYEKKQDGKETDKEASLL